MKTFLEYINQKEEITDNSRFTEQFDFKRLKKLNIDKQKVSATYILTTSYDSIKFGLFSVETAIGVESDDNSLDPMYGGGSRFIGQYKDIDFYEFDEAADYQHAMERIAVGEWVLDHIGRHTLSDIHILLTNTQFFSDPPCHLTGKDFFGSKFMKDYIINLNPMDQYKIKTMFPDLPITIDKSTEKGGEAGFF